MLLTLVAALTITIHRRRMNIMAKPHRTLPALTQQDILRFHSNYQKRDPNDCWEWRLAKLNGYGAFCFNNAGSKSLLYAHRVAYLLHYGVDPLEWCVCHRCDNPKCVNPSHLFLGTDAENKTDMITKKRHPFGNTHGRRQLTEDDVREIRKMRANGEINTNAQRKDVAKRFGVTDNVIQGVIYNRKWKHV